MRTWRDDKICLTRSCKFAFALVAITDTIVTARHVRWWGKAYIASYICIHICIYRQHNIYMTKAYIKLQAYTALG